MITQLKFIYAMIFSLLALLSVTLLVRGAVARRQAGPVRFRLGPAARADWRQNGFAAYGPVWFVSFAGFLALLSIFPGVSIGLFLAFLWWFVHSLALGSTRNGARRWLVPSSGSLGLVIGAMVLAGGLQVFSTQGLAVSELLPRALVLVYSIIFLVLGVAAIREFLSGTLVRERGLEIMGTIHPWSRVVVEGWHEREGGFALRLCVLPPRLFEIRFGRPCEITVPVPASGRPALQAFLAGRAANTG